MDFFAPFDTKSFSAYSAGMAAAGTSSYLSNPMSQYYGASPASMAASQFMSAAASPTSMAASMYSASAGHMAALQGAPSGTISPLTSSSSAAVAQNFALGGSGNPISPSIIGAMT